MLPLSDRSQWRALFHHMPGQWDRRSISGPLYELGFKPASAADFGLSLALLALIVAAFGVAFLAAAAILVHWREERET